MKRLLETVSKEEEREKYYIPREVAVFVGRKTIYFRNYDSRSRLSDFNQDCGYNFSNVGHFIF